MPEDVRLHMFECGTLECHVENIKMNQGLGDEYSIPVPWFLVTHPKGNVVIDGGNAAQCATDALRMWQTPGHAPGHQSFEVALPNTGSVLLTVDAAYTMDHWNEKALPGFLASAVDSVRSVRELHRIAERSGSTVVTGHDPDKWPSFKQAPEYYD
jgi:glyoxylase-like metal-dependent hydrolase (beta-lactamase superfamily II)